MLPCLVFEDDHLLAVNKPAGLNTHAPSPYAGEGIYDWLKHREPRWQDLAIIHRLDKETSGILVFGKTPLANQSLTRQFTERTIHKKYLFLTDRSRPRKALTVRSYLIRAGEKYFSRPTGSEKDYAETRFQPSALRCHVAGQDMMPRGASETEPFPLVEAVPVTGRTHQIRVHAAQSGFAILGDERYGGTPASRVYLHAAELTLQHPASGKELRLKAPLEFARPAQSLLRRAIIDEEFTNAYRLINGASDGWPQWYLDRFGDYLLSQSEQPLSEPQSGELAENLNSGSLQGAYHKVLSRHVRKAAPAASSPRLAIGAQAPARFLIRENGLRFEASFEEGYSVGLFLDQRDNRRRLLIGHVAAGFSMLPGTKRDGAGTSPTNAQPEVLNTFAYTCGFSVSAACGGFRTTSLDLSKKYLEWGKRNFVLNHLDPQDHEFIHGDVFDWLRRFAKKGRTYDVILLDPPTFSRSKHSGSFQAEKDYRCLITAALPVLKPAGVLFCSTNASQWSPEQFLSEIERAIRKSGKRTVQKHYVPQPPDFPVSRAEPAYLKTVWLRLV